MQLDALFLIQGRVSNSVIIRGQLYCSSHSYIFQFTNCISWFTMFIVWSRVVYIYLVTSTKQVDNSLFAYPPPDMSMEDRLRMQSAARDSVSTRFSEPTFDADFLKCVAVVMDGKLL